jgi:hypothetical protein
MPEETSKYKPFYIVYCDGSSYGPYSVYDDACKFAGSMVKDTGCDTYILRTKEIISPDITLVKVAI